MQKSKLSHFYSNSNNFIFETELSEENIDLTFQKITDRYNTVNFFDDENSNQILSDIEYYEEEEEDFEEYVNDYSSDENYTEIELLSNESNDSEDGENMEKIENKSDNDVEELDALSNNENDFDDENESDSEANKSDDDIDENESDNEVSKSDDDIDENESDNERKCYDGKRNKVKKADNSNQKKKRKKLLPEDALRIWKVFKLKGVEFAKDFCLNLDYKKSTFYKIIQNEGIVPGKWLHPKPHPKWKDKDIENVLQFISDNPALTLNELIDKAIYEKGSEKVSTTTLSNYLRSQLITLKDIRFHPAARNTEQTKQQRIDYCNKFLANSSKSFVFIDEMGVSIGTQRNKGRSRRGKRAISISPLSKAPNMSLCMAINKDHGMIHYSIQNKSFSGDSFNTFIINLIKKCKKLKMKNICLILDNCKIHKVKQIKKECRKNKIQIMFLPPYSPELNPIENAFSILKCRIKNIFKFC